MKKSFVGKRRRKSTASPSDFQIAQFIRLSDRRWQLWLVGRSPNADHPTKVEIQDVKGTGKDITIFLNRHLIVKALEFGLTKAEFIDSISPMRFVDGGRAMIVMPTRPIVAASAPAAQASDEAPAPEESTPPHWVCGQCAKMI